MERIGGRSFIFNTLKSPKPSLASPSAHTSVPKYKKPLTTSWPDNIINKLHTHLTFLFAEFLMDGKLISQRLSKQNNKQNKMRREFVSIDVRLHFFYFMPSHQRATSYGILTK